MKTAATRERSSRVPVSFSTIEASVTNSSMSASGRSGDARAQMLVDQLLLVGQHLGDDLLARWRRA